MPLEDVGWEKQGKHTFFMLVATIVGILLPAWLPRLEPWRITTVCLLVAAAPYLSGRPRYKPWSLLFDAMFVGGATLFDWLSQQSSAIISPTIFAVTALAVMVPFSVWLNVKERRAMPKRAGDSGA